MNTRRKITIVWAISLLIVISCHGQNYTVHFGYDDNGNRISRTLTVAKMEQNYNPTDTIKTTESIEETHNILGITNVSVFPNPTHEKVTISLQGLCNNSVTACITTITGTILIMSELSEGIHDFDLSDLSSGVYLLHITVADKSQTWKIIKEQ